MERNKGTGLHIKRYLISGIVAIIPLGITWLLFDFIFGQLARFGLPLVRIVAKDIRDDAPGIAKLLLEPWFQDLLAVIIVLVGLYLLGWVTNRVVGKRVLSAFESLLDRVPLVKTIYGSVKKLIGVLQTKPDNVQRVVLIEFPHSEMKCIGLVTRTLIDETTGAELAAVYVPTTPNPTSGYLEIVPVDRIVSTDWTIDEAMNFLISGGAVAPDRIPFSAAKSASPTKD